jgi:hypothetical protein
MLSPSSRYKTSEAVEGFSADSLLSKLWFQFVLDAECYMVMALRFFY